MGGGNELCLARAEEAARLAAELAAREVLDCSDSAAEVEVESTAKVKRFIEAEPITVNAKTMVDTETSSGIAMGDTRNP